MQTPGPTALQSASEPHAAQTFVERLQIGVCPPQSAFERQPTHMPILALAEPSVAVTQTGVKELSVLQASELPHPAQLHVFVSQIGFALSVHVALFRQLTHVPFGALTAPSDPSAQKGVAPFSFVQASLVPHASTHRHPCHRFGLLAPVGHVVAAQENGLPPAPPVPPTPARSTAAGVASAPPSLGMQ